MKKLLNFLLYYSGSALSGMARMIAMLMLVMGLAALSYSVPHIHKSYIRQKVGSKVVMLLNGDPADRSYTAGGTGFHVVAPSGRTYIVTNRHVCNLARNTGILYAAITGQTRYYKLHIIEESDIADVCIMEGIPGVEGLKIGEDPEIGQSVIAVGHPNLQPRTLTEGDVVGTELIEIPIGVVGYDLDASDCKHKDTYALEYMSSAVATQMLHDILEEGYLSSGTLSRIQTMLKNNQFSNETKVSYCFSRTYAVITTIMVYRGSSGSPVVDMFGDVVGVVYAIGKERMWGRVVQLSDLRDLLSKY